MELGVVIARDEGEQARSVVTLPREPAFALAQFVFAEAEAPAATVGDEERIRRNIERCSPMSPKGVEADRLSRPDSR